MSEPRATEKSVPVKVPAPASPSLAMRSFFNPMTFSFLKDFSEEWDRRMRPFDKRMKDEFWSPVVDVQRSNGTLTVKAELPGLKKEEVRVEVDGDNLIIAGERKREEEEETEETYRLERSYGQFWRSLPLPAGSKADQVKAQLTDGVLTVTMPVLEIKTDVKTIPIEEGDTLKAAAVQ